MGKTLAIAIGINQYQVFQPLNYAQQDAQALWDFAAYQAGVPANQCLLLTDTSLPLEGRSTYPNRETIQGWIETLGSGGQLEGLSIQPEDQLWFFFSGYGVSYDGKDYLMPIEGNPANVEATGIPMRSLFTRLRGTPTDKILVLLDINRASSTQSGSLLGTETAKLAREMEIATVLSCQPGQFSQETSDLRHGLFTAALLEGLRSGQCNTLASLDNYLLRRLQELSDHHMRPVQQPLMLVNPPGKVHQEILPLTNKTASGAAGAKLASPASSNLKNKSNNTMPEPQNSPETEDDAQFWQMLTLTCAGLAFVLIAGVLYANRSVFVGENNITSSPMPGEPSPTSQQETPLAVSKPPSVAEQTASQPGTPQQETVPPIAVPPPMPAESPTSVRQPVAQPPSPQPSNRDLLGRARTSIGSTQASSYLAAIEVAARIQPGEPEYQEAREDIERWSRAILDIAVGRSRLGNFRGAIAAADLVPDDSEVYGEARSAIARWQQQAQQQQVNQDILAQARALPQWNQASSYNNAINVARRVPTGQPNYFEARSLIEQWSEDILEISYFRASQGALSGAIAAASLVPADSQVHSQATEAIATWQSRLNAESEN